MMLRRLAHTLAPIPALIGFAIVLGCNTASATTPMVPEPVVDDSLAAAKSQKTLVLAGGCFWGIQLVFEHVKGVISATSGYAGGNVEYPSYEMVSSGRTGHAESVRIVYDPSQVTLGEILKVFFSVAHNPTELNRQGPDVGIQYRSAIFYSDPSQQRIAQAYVDQINQAKIYSSKIVTQIVPFQAFYSAEKYHQDFAVYNPDNPYIRFNDLPKLEDLRRNLTGLYVEKKASAGQ
jgi:peptide-methionine (S)-S-oxide reductase